MAARDYFRAHGRVPVKIDAVLRQQGDVLLPLTIRDLGFGGAGIEIADPTFSSAKQETSASLDLATGNPVVLELVAPVLWDPLLLPGKIVWSVEKTSTNQTTRAGIRFDPLGATTLLSLFDVLSSN